MIYASNFLLYKRSVLRRQCRDTNRNIKRSVYCQYGYYSLTFRALAREKTGGRANARNVRLYYPYWQYTDLFMLRFLLYICVCLYIHIHVSNYKKLINTFSFLLFLCLRSSRERLKKRTVVLLCNQSEDWFTASDISISFTLRVLERNFSMFLILKNSTTEQTSIRS